MVSAGSTGTGILSVFTVMLKEQLLLSKEQLKRVSVSAKGVPAAFNLIFCKPVFWTVPLPVNLNPLLTFVLILYTPVFVIFTSTITKKLSGASDAPFR